MLFSVEFPQILAHLGELAYGLQPVRVPPDGRLCLIIKINKEAILTTRLNRQIKIYLIPDVHSPGRAHGCITAFFDDHDEPLVICSPLFAEDALARDLGLLLGQGVFNLYFFDEHDRELLGVSARLAEADRFGATWNGCRLSMFDLARVPDMLNAMHDWFAYRTASDDAAAFTVHLESELYPADFVFIDARPEATDYRGAGADAAVNSLEREEPGAYQERDIARLLRRAFAGDCVFLNPIRDDTGKELADVMCITDDIILVVQAKDSPNTERALRRSIERKRATIRAHIEKGAAQLRGAMTYILEREAIVIRDNDDPQTLAVGDRLICGLIVVREMFDDDYRACSIPVLAAAQACEAPAVLLEYAALHVMALRLPSPARLMNGLIQLFEVALQKGEYPKPRFLLGPVDKAPQTGA